MKILKNVDKLLVFTWHGLFLYTWEIDESLYIRIYVEESKRWDQTGNVY